MGLIKQGFTYKEFEKVINENEGFTFEYFPNGLTVFYNYKKDSEQWGENTVREPLFTISTIKAFSIISPYGFRLTYMKQMKGFKVVESAALKLSNTPIHMRGGE